MNHECFVLFFLLPPSDPCPPSPCACSLSKSDPEPLPPAPSPGPGDERLTALAAPRMLYPPTGTLSGSPDDCCCLGRPRAAGAVDEWLMGDPPRGPKEGSSTRRFAGIDGIVAEADSSPSRPRLVRRPCPPRSRSR
ncbi:hypothetical protein K466DRAFT_583550 [Polyporus arcularius HHB13444]|uniref:Uncharacterized protein n=1 Tax=Polyporus arcularius HHB13444 TaxID=1314778 RepID=A0A5C3PX64_9APHY|nr:hypothetical protein K466DRAFT_583550 [Polyporus arcularius HHB13444]